MEAQIRLGVQVNGYGVNALVGVRPLDAGGRGRSPGRGVRRRVPARAVAPGRRRASRLAPRCGPDRGGAAQLPRGRRASGRSRTRSRTWASWRQLPGIGVQRLMADGYGFGAEGDWKTAVLVRTMKVMAAGLPGGTSFMEDYTYHLVPARPQVLGAHMLEVCPSIAGAHPDRARSTRSRSAVGPIRSASSSRPAPDRRSPWVCSTWASGSGWSSTRSTSWCRRRTCPGCPSPGPSGSRGRA